MTGKTRIVRLRNGEDRRYLSAYLDERGDLTLHGHDFGEATTPVSSSGEYEWETTVAAEHLPHLLEVLDGEPGEHILDCLARAWTGPRSSEAESQLRESGIPVSRYVS